MSAADPVVESPRLIERLPFVEGLRGLAAVIVVVGHLIHGAGDVKPDGSIFDASTAQLIGWPAWPGTEMVALFILVSGFSLAYSEDRRRLSRPATTVRQFAKRRAWRIMPVYYVALAFGLIALAIVPNHYLDVTDLKPQAITAPGMTAHLFLVHNVRDSWQYQGNGPLWSMAVEVQLYLLFGLLFWGMRRWRAPWGAIAMALLAIALDVGRRKVFPDFQAFGLLRWFALGMLVASVYREPLIQRLPVRLVAAIGLAALAIAYLRLDRLSGDVAHDALWGTAFTALLLAMALRPQTQRNPLNTASMRWLGLRSYSLYALHFPVAWLLFGALAAAGVANGVPRGVIMFVVGLPLSILVATVGFRYIEGPSLDKVRAVK